MNSKLKLSEVKEIVAAHLKHERECQCETHLKDGRIDAITEHAISMVVEDYRAFNVMMNIMAEILIRDDNASTAFISMVKLSILKSIKKDNLTIEEILASMGVKVINLSDLGGN